MCFTISTFVLLTVSVNLSGALHHIATYFYVKEVVPFVHKLGEYFWRSLSPFWSSHIDAGTLG